MVVSRAREAHLDAAGGILWLGAVFRVLRVTACAACLGSLNGVGALGAVVLRGALFQRRQFLLRAPPKYVQLMTDAACVTAEVVVTITHSTPSACSTQ